MSFTIEGGNAARNDYDYQSGSGMDGFLSRSLDEVSWETTLGSTVSTLGALPIGTSQSNAINYDAQQISGSQGDTTTLGGSAGGSAGTNGGNLQIDAGNNRITLSDGTNTRLLLGYSQGGF